jgi:hypothetical protein
MNELIEHPIQQDEDKIMVVFTFANGSEYTQHVYLKNADMVEDLLKWYRDKNSKPTWTWDYSKVSKLMLIQKSQIVTIEIEGYIELVRITQKWHEKLFDKFITAVIFLRMNGGGKHG